VVELASPVTGSIWKLLCGVGDAVAEGQTLVIVESMKMEFPVDAPQPGVVAAIKVAEGDHVKSGDPVLSLESN
jgi:biotin carboxyl carrier protein